MKKALLTASLVMFLDTNTADLDPPGLNIAVIYGGHIMRLKAEMDFKIRYVVLQQA